MSGLNAPFRPPTITPGPRSSNLLAPQSYKARRPDPTFCSEPLDFSTANGTGPDQRYFPQLAPGVIATPNLSYAPGAVAGPVPIPYTQPIRDEREPGPSGSGFDRRLRSSADGYNEHIDPYAFGPTISERRPSAGPSMVRFDPRNEYSARPRRDSRWSRPSSRSAPNSGTAATAPHPIVVLDSPELAERAAEERRHAEQEDPDAVARAFEVSERRDREKREGLAAARKSAARGGGAAAQAASAARSAPKSHLDSLFTKADNKNNASRAKDGKRRAEVTDHINDVRSKGKSTGKKRQNTDSKAENGSREPLGDVPNGLSEEAAPRGGFVATRCPSPPSERLASSSLPASPIEPIPSLEEMWEQEQRAGRKAQRKRVKGKQRATYHVEEVQRRDEDSAADSPDELLEKEAAAPDFTTLCPFCDQPFPEQPTPQLLATRQALLRYPHERRPTLQNKDAVRFPEGQHVVRTGAFCKMHHNERTVIPAGRARGYPSTIAWNELPRRIERQLSSHLADVILGKLDSPFLAAARAAWDAGEWKNVLSEYGSFDVEEPGYYGPLGFDVIKQALSHLFVATIPLVTPHRTAPLSVDFYLRRVLVPECAVELIRGDLAEGRIGGGEGDKGKRPCTRAEAERVRTESRAYGRAVFPNEGEVEERCRAAAADGQEDQHVDPQRGEGVQPSGRGTTHARERGTDESRAKKRRRQRMSWEVEEEEGVHPLHPDGDPGEQEECVATAPPQTAHSSAPCRQPKTYPSARRCVEGLAPDSMDHRQTALEHLAAALDPAQDDALAEVKFEPGAFARQNQERQATAKRDQREQRKRARQKKKRRLPRDLDSSSSSSCDGEEEEERS